MRYNNVGTSFFRFAYAFDRQTERPLQYRALHYMQSHGKKQTTLYTYTVFQ